MTNQAGEEDSTIYKVVVNHEEQYSIWPEWRENPLGWRDDGVKGTKAQCLAHIKEVWTDMRPLKPPPADGRGGFRTKERCAHSRSRTTAAIGLRRRYAGS